jgi:hypothetical protein
VSAAQRLLLQTEIRAAQMMILAREKQLAGDADATATAGVDYRAWQMILNVRRRFGVPSATVLAPPVPAKNDPAL